MRGSYDAFLSSKFSSMPPSGITDIPPLIAGLNPHQGALVRWSLRRGKSAIFAQTGLGKTRMELAWCDALHRVTGGDSLILAPLAVAAQTVREGMDVGIHVTLARTDSDIRPGVNIVNYERLHLIDTDRFNAVALDESSVIKHKDSRTFSQLLEAFCKTPYRLSATATPAPNDWVELGTQAEFLGVCSRVEMLSEFFCHDGGETQVWRLKKHARVQFWQWVATWGAMVRKPSDLGFDDTAYILPPLTIHEHICGTDAQPAPGMLFNMEANTMMERRQARRDSLAQRVKACADMVNADDEMWLVWCDLNPESEALAREIDGAVEVRGSDSTEYKEESLQAFAEGRIRVLVSKPSIAGWGLNFQSCARMAFVGVTDSYEAQYQAIRRCWRFGQKRPVDVHLFASELEGAVLANLKRKELEAEIMGAELSAMVGAVVRSEVLGMSRNTNAYNARSPVSVPSFLRM